MEFFRSGLAKWSFALVGLLFISFSNLAAQKVSLPGPAGVPNLPNVLIEKVLERSERYSASFPDAGKSVNMARQVSKVLSGEYQLFWTLTSKEHEEQFIPIRIPIYRGMLGMRVCLVNRKNREIFKNVHTLEQLLQFQAGQGKLWSDTFIMESNKIPVVKVVKYPSLFPMLDGDRFHYFPRGAHEPWAEMRNYSQYDLVVEPYLLIKYTAPFYFFVNKESPDLANYVREALEKMVSSGEFETLFYQDEQVRDAIEKASINNRRLIELDNPYLTPETPLEREELWYSP